MSRGLRSRVGDRSRLGVSGDDTTAPTITSLDVSTGTYLGGTEVTITGTGFNDVTAVSFNGVAADSFTVDSDTQITATTDASDDDGLGLGDVVVTDPYGSDTLTNGWTYSVLDGATEYWLASLYSGSGSWLGAKGVADLAFPGGSADPSWLPHSTGQNQFGAGVDYVVSPGTANNWVSTPDAAALDITGDITLVIRFCPTGSWAPSSTHYPIAKYSSSTTISYGLSFSTGSSTPTFVWSATGSAASSANATTGIGFSASTAGWLAATLDVDDGAGNKVVKFWKSSTNTNDPNAASWSQLGSTITTAGTTSIANTTSPLGVLGYLAGAICSNGSCSRAQVYSGVRDFSGTPSGGTLVADFNPNGGTWGSTETTLTGTGDSLTWTVNRSTSGRRAWAITRDAFSFGTDDYLSTPDNALFDFGASQDFTVAALFRARQQADAAIQTIISKRDVTTGTAGWSSRVEGTTSTTEFSSTVEAADAVTTVSDATWNNPGTLQTHIVTRTAGATGTLNIYTDAVDVGGAAAEPGDTGNALVMSVGRVLSSGSGTNFYEGLIGAIAIFRTGLTAAQVTQLDAELRALA